MKFALFYEIPVPRPWEPDSELNAYQHTLEGAIAGDGDGGSAVERELQPRARRETVDTAPHGEGVGRSPSIAARGERTQRA